MAEGSNEKRTPEESRAAIERLDLAKIVEKAMQTYGWSREQAMEADRWYRNFLQLCHQHDGPVAAIGRDADDLWHIHILDTRKYAADCHAIFGRFLPHEPIYGEPSAEHRQLFEQTHALYQSTFGSVPQGDGHVSSFGGFAGSTSA